jgi:hypothetical protein
MFLLRWGGESAAAGTSGDDSRQHRGPNGRQTLKIIDPLVIGGEAALVVFFGILIFLAVGRRIGQRAITRSGDVSLANVGSLETAVFAILGLLIAFTFSGALTRFDLRRAQIVDEANAIGTAYLRIDVLPSGAQPRLRQAFRDYVDARIATYTKLPDLQAAHNELMRSQELQADIWAQAVLASGTPDSRPGIELLMLPALNQMFDITTVRAMASQMHPPLVVFAMLIALALASALLAGYQSAGAKAYHWCISWDLPASSRSPSS